MTRPHLRRAVVAVALALALAACGTTEDDAADADDPAPEAAEPVTVVDARGEEVVLEDGPAQRVVALEWMQAEVAVTLGVMPVGVADVDGYTTWVSAAAPLDDTVADVGTRGEPSVDAVIDLDPDLILVEAGASEDVVDRLDDYAPVVVVQGSDASDNLGQMRTNVETIATALGKEAEAEEVLAELDAAIEDGAAALEEAGVAGDGFAMADGWMDGSTVSIRMFGEGSLMSDLAEALGLENRWTGEVDEMWGLGVTDVEGLTNIGDAHFFYSASEDDVFGDGLAGNPIWDSLPFVVDGDVHKLEAGTWTFGGPAAAQFFIDQVVEGLTG
ncbi:ABC transporter substrate-binding protein [Actinomarinicola tropica]|uniref:ABC transporter substrate-binding protein n=1 Tax=Actinomarinicola tropica TaxID=2789776 RepID=A0A5Q2RGS1_9ACTN|nr:iron-siderophore ABC transporter substrate-binding protein [Actinomarinicola tropica]QGG96029.1 ABC transporter substrate-binding protein [Actinomarinicola tropica]